MNNLEIIKELTSKLNWMGEGAKSIEEHYKKQVKIFNEDMLLTIIEMGGSICVLNKKETFINSKSWESIYYFLLGYRKGKFGDNNE